MSTTRTDPAQRAAMAAARHITKHLWSLRDERGKHLGVGTLDIPVPALALWIVADIRRALRKKPRRKGAKR